MRPLSTVVALAATLGMSVHSYSATLQPVQAPVSINHGQGFHNVAGSAVAKVGDIVMAGPGGNAQLVYEDGCKVSISPGAVVTVEELSPCAANAYAQAAPQPQNGGDNFGRHVAGGVLLAAGFGGAIYAISRTKQAAQYLAQEKPASP